MNAKKITSVLAFGLGTLLVAASCNNTPAASSSGAMTRTNAVTTLNAISAHVKASGFVAPSKGVIAGAKTKVNVSKDDSFISTEYLAANTVNSVAVAKDTKVYGFGTAASYTVYMTDGTTSSVFTDTTGALKTTVDGKIAAYLANATYASAFAKYLGNFNDDGSAITGGTAKNATLKSQSYASTGEGNLTVDITVHYSYDEGIIYKWDNYLCVKQRDTALTWGSATTTAPTTAGATAVTTADAIVALL